MDEEDMLKLSKVIDDNIPAGYGFVVITFKADSSNAKAALANNVGREGAIQVLHQILGTLVKHNN